ncbi:MAG: hypothetical protein KKD44_29390 [Proteobacteria bacterium]|nr:hypothetical protein [Pseudomonadota bacterium]
MAASVATFDNNMADLVFELSDREIYNDIRSEIDVTVTDTDTVIDSDAIYDGGSRSIDRENMGAGTSVDIDVYSLTGDRKVNWLNARITYASNRFQNVTQEWCEGLGGNWYPPFDPKYPAYSYSVCYFLSFQAQMDAEIIAEYDNYCTVRVTNNAAVALDFHLSVTYNFLLRPIQTHEVSSTQQVTLTVRAIDDTSVLKYGRRVMNLRWALGQTEEQMQILLDAYLDRHSEPVDNITMTLEGHDSTLVTQILTRKISDCITVINDEMSINADYFINAIDVNKHVDGLLEARYVLERLRGAAYGSGREDVTWFLIGTSLLDGPHFLAP